MTPLELIAGEKARREIVEHVGVRRILKMDELAQMTDLRPRLEKEMRLPGDARGAKNRIYFFSIDGVLSGNFIKGALLGGECMMVQATSFTEANKLAKEGLHHTLEISHEYFNELQRSIVTVSPVGEQFMQIDVGGSRAAAELHAPDLATDPKLRRLLAHKIGKKPWAG